MINSANQYPVHSLLSHESNTVYKVPPYQREYSWQKPQWEDLFDDLIEADGAHFLGTIITLNQTVDTVDANVLELIDGQQRMTTLTLLMTAAYSVLRDNVDDLDEDTHADMTNLRRQLVRRNERTPRVTPQLQGHNLDDYRAVLASAGLPVDAEVKNYISRRRVHRCYMHFRAELAELAESENLMPFEVALRVLKAVQQAIIVKIEVASHADAFVLFESLNNRGMPLTPVDLIKTHLLAQSERKAVMRVEVAFGRWNEMLTNLGDNYANQERFLRHYYNAFKAELPQVTRAPLATKASLIRIYEALVADDIQKFIDKILPASAIYGRITDPSDENDKFDVALRQLTRAQGAPSYMLMLWLMTKRDEFSIQETHLVRVTEFLTNFFVRRNLTGHPQTYALPKLFMDIIAKVAVEVATGSGSGITGLVSHELASVSDDDDQFLQRLMGPIYEENSGVTRFILTTLAENEMTKENRQNLWQWEKGQYLWTIEHILPQGANLPQAWLDMLGGGAAEIQTQHVHRLGNLTITGYNSNLGNKSFSEKRDRVDSANRYIGYRNGLSLNADVVTQTQWAGEEIEARTITVAQRVVARFPLTFP